MAKQCMGNIQCRMRREIGEFCRLHQFTCVLLLEDAKRMNKYKYRIFIETINEKMDECRRVVSATKIQSHWRRVMVRNRLANPMHPWGKARLEREFKGF